MFAAWMLFATELSALLFVSAWIAEWALRPSRKPVRGVWAAAILGANVLPLILAKLPVGSALAGRWTMQVAPDSVLTKLTTPLAVLWGLSAAVGLSLCVAAVWRLARTRTQWKNEHVDNTPVLVSHDVGPALVGVMQYSIVVPRWAQTLDQGARKLLVAHEREHARKYDPLLSAAATLAVVVAPWNVFNWLFFRRLHLAIELDCDQRVLREHPDARSYGALLLDVAERVLPSVMPAAAFVEHGASLETRINAMSANRKPYETLRAASGLGLSLVVALAACFTPRPYAIVIVNPPATASGLQSVSERAKDEPAAAVQVIPLSQQTLAGVVKAPSEHKPETSQPSTVSPSNDDDEVRPVPMSARVKALDNAEDERMRKLVTKHWPRTLWNFNRADSGLVLLLNDNGEVRKQVAVQLADFPAGTDPLYVFSTIFPQPYANGIESASMFSIDRGTDNEPLRTPLKVFTAYLIPGVKTPPTLAEMTPSPETIVAAARARHRMAFSSVSPKSNVVALLYDTKGALLNSANILLDSTSTTDQNYLWKRAFGAYMDLGKVLFRSTQSVTGDTFVPTQVIVAHGTMIMNTEISEFEKAVQYKQRNWTFGGAASREGRGRSFDWKAMTARLDHLVQSRVPDAYGDWSRADSAVVFLFDANEQLVARKAGPLTDRTALLDLADYISLRVLTVSPNDIESVGWTNHVTSSSGRLLDKPLKVYWGRLSADATRKRELSLRQTR